jgi:Stress responsive A/B Barrel Domain
MKSFLIAIVVVVVTSLAISSGAPESVGTKANGKLIHMVSFKFKPTATPAQIKEVEDAFRALKKRIPQIVSYEWGTNVSPEKHDKGFTHGFILSFKSAEHRDAYLVHPEHKKFGELVGPVLADVFVIDFWAKP